MAWRDSLQPASFRGVSFGVTRASDTLGRRVVRHDFPQRDDPYVEDMARAPRDITITGFVLGADYMARRDALQEALDMPGPGTLVHPWYGSFLVSLTSARVEHTATDGGMAVFTMSFVRVDTAARAARPRSGTDRATLVSLRSQSLADLLAVVLENALSLEGVLSIVMRESRDALLDSLIRAGDVLGLDLTGSVGWLRRVIADPNALEELIASGSLGSSLATLFAEAGSGRLSGSNGIPPEPQRFFAASRALKIPPVPVAGITRTTAARNAAAITGAVGNLCIVQGLAATAGHSPASRDAAQALRGEIMDAVDALAQRLPATTAGDEAMATAMDLRSAALLLLAERAGTAPDIGTVRLARSLPVLAAVWRYTGTLEAVEDFVARNAIAHPGFAPADRALEVLNAR